MSHVVKKHKFWLIPLCVLAAAAVFLYGWQQLNAQDMPQPPAPAGVAGSPGVAGAPPASGTGPDPLSPSYEPSLSLDSVVPTGIRVTKTKNWDGTVTEFLSFKYKTLDNRFMSVLLPATYKTEKRTRAAWDTLFQVFAMDYEYQLEAIEKERVPDVSAFMGEFMREIQGQVPGGTALSPNPAGQATDYARSHLSSVWGGSIELPPLLPGMM